jgi:hypothetical protein
MKLITKFSSSDRARRSTSLSECRVPDGSAMDIHAFPHVGDLRIVYLTPGQPNVIFATFSDTDHSVGPTGIDRVGSAGQGPVRDRLLVAAYSDRRPRCVAKHAFRFAEEDGWPAPSWPSGADKCDARKTQRCVERAGFIHPLWESYLSQKVAAMTF